MDAAVTTLKFENKSAIPTDPRTKLCYSHRSEDKIVFNRDCQYHYDYR